MIHEYRTYLFKRMFDELNRKAPGRAEQLCHEIFATAELVQAPSRSLFVLALQ
jgi:hypothetical protein